MAPPAAVLRAMHTLRLAVLPGVGRTEQSVLIELLSYVSLRDPREPVHPRACVLAEQLHLACVTVRRALVRLHRAGLIERLHQEHSERTGNFRTVRTRISDTVLRMAGLLQDNAGRAEVAGLRSQHPAHPERQVLTWANETVARIDQKTVGRPDTPPKDVRTSDTRPCIFGIHAIENGSTENQNSTSTAIRVAGRYAQRGSLPADLQPWVDHGITPAALATGMKLARQAGTTLSAILLAIGDRLRRAAHPQAYLMSTLHRLVTERAPVWEAQRPKTTLGPIEATAREQTEASAVAQLVGLWFTDGYQFYRPVGSLCEVYGLPPSTGTPPRPDRAPIPTARLRKWMAEGRITPYAVARANYDVSLLRKALHGCPA